MPPRCQVSAYAHTGYTLKDRIADVGAFTAAVQRVANGGSALDPEVLDPAARPPAAPGPLAASPPREREVLGLMAEGRSNSATAEALVVTERVMEKHVTGIVSKLSLPPAVGGLLTRVRRAGVPRLRIARNWGVARTGCRGSARPY
jgi:DNA-binding NarL/FixJ family response regulator